MLRRAYSGITERSMTWGRGDRLRKFWRVGVSRKWRSWSWDFCGYTQLMLLMVVVAGPTRFHDLPFVT
ncbi:hypothetical protein B296_00052834 [Ensete ventricosum]|uniref:Uncharacterized protein n=1 Tax=Ensete ventricosum TaxID=4639 RepID=A0A426X9X2_ENSVE|nr:hypothetical protein B296_00052834 [Ensete ventricosum]